jgi:hypothetical protein
MRDSGEEGKTRLALTSKYPAAGQCEKENENDEKNKAIETQNCMPKAQDAAVDHWLGSQ